MPFKTKEERNAYLAKWRAENRERLRSYQLEWSRTRGVRPASTWRDETFGTPEQRKERRRAFYRDYNNRPHRREYVAAWERENRDKVQAKLRRWQQSPKGKAWASINQSRRRGAPGRCTREQLLARIAYYGERCWMCGKPWEHVDHVIPISKGGTNWASNLRPACATCNTSKGATRNGKRDQSRSEGLTGETRV